MRIGIVCHPTIGGSGLIATQLGIGLARIGYEVHFISHARPFKLVDEKGIFFHCVEGIDYPLFDDPLYTFALTAKIVEIANTYDLDLVHAHYSIPHSLCAYLASEITHKKFPTVTTIHGTDVTVVGQDKPLYPLNRFSINKSTVVTTVSNFQRRYTKEQFDIRKSIEVIYNFIDLDVFSPKHASLERRRMLASDDEKILMHISNFRPVKNTEAVIETFHMVQAKVNARLVLLGNGPDLNKIKLLCQQLGIAEKVTFLGDVMHVENIIPNADCVFQPSYHESFSMVALEAMACGVPTVTSNADGIPEVVEQGKSGFMSEPNDILAMAKDIIDVLSDTQLQQRMGAYGRKRAEQNFCWSDKIAEYVKCYENAILKYQPKLIEFPKTKQQ
ncbi:N-acetyl-alpha-D-glucosaminyl L-malate synthase BshA [Thalassotalea psychrophila]|uniref:N-acetyl-alpha-D-glucosaminyl L-malate synthase BshA n=1 Tax=Thalassotalea psychrophila TaxID=3065647 RepID=A0ABY9TVP5_9GAMM|nr:N-acetyl-alpha-D-glucosaminyl L-malate synthase BshA [Colwelliaceae bacterium SQ149]